MNIEEGTDTLDPRSNLNLITKPLDICDEIKRKNLDLSIKQNRRVSRSAGSYSDEESAAISKPVFVLGSEPLLNTSYQSQIQSFEEVLLDSSQKDIIQKWLENTPCSSNENICPSVISSSASPKGNNPLTARTSALLTRKTFNLVKPKP